MSANTYSVFIPHLATKYDEAAVNERMVQCAVGHVSQIKFVPIDNDMNAAFVHFHGPLPIYEKPDEDPFWSAIHHGPGVFQLQVSPTEYWACHSIDQSLTSIATKQEKQLEKQVQHLERQVQHLEKQGQHLEKQGQQLETMQKAMAKIRIVLHHLINGHCRDEHDRLNSLNNTVQQMLEFDRDAPLFGYTSSSSAKSDLFSSIFSLSEKK